MIGKLLVKLNDLRNIKRYQNLTKLAENSVLEHEARVAKYAVILSKWEKNKFGNEVNLEEVLLRALHHDDLEAFTGDILSHTKRTTPELKKAINDMEQIRFDLEFKPLLPKSFREDYERYVLNAKDETIEGKIIEASDIIDTIYECAEEIKLGNRRFERILIEVTESLMEVDLESVRYFMKYPLSDIGLDVTRYFGINVARFIESIEFDENVFSNPYLKEDK